MNTEETEPKKYIRTLAGDMDILKSGGTPDLVPFSKSRPSPDERLVAASPVAAVPNSLPPTPIPSSNIGHVSASPLSIPTMGIEPPPVSRVQSEFEEKPAEPTPIETYSSDFFDRMKEENASPVTILAAEQDALPEEMPPEPMQHARNGVIYSIVGVLLLIAGGSGVYIAYTRYAASLAPVILAPIIQAPILVDDREQISGVGPALEQAIEQSVTRPLAEGTVRLLYTTSATTTDNSIFSALQVPAPDILLRNLNAEGSMAGVININGDQSPFFILSVASYSSTFSGMLSWEPLMPRDLEGLFPVYAIPASITTTTIASSSVPVTAAIPKTFVAGFRDEVVGNHNVRMYRDAADRSILLYGYWNQTTLVIARDSSAFTEILNRLGTSQTQR